MVSVEELKMQFEKLREEEEGKSSFGSILCFLEMAISTYQEMQQEKGWEEEEEAIFNGHMILNEKEKGKKEKKMENLSSKKTTKKRKNKVKNRYNVRKQQKRGIQQRGETKRLEIEREGGKKARFDQEGREKMKGSYKGLKQDANKQYFFRDKG